MNETILGRIEYVTFPDLDITKVKAKIDTGAYSGAIYCTDICETTVNGKKVLRFHLLGDANRVHTAAHFRETFVRSATGHTVQRYIINTSISIHGVCYAIKIGLSDRTGLRYPVLIGRKFLRKNNMLVDVRINKRLDDKEEYIE